jgi:hypothetical protein
MTSATDQKDRIRKYKFEKIHDGLRRDKEDYWGQRSESTAT